MKNVSFSVFEEDDGDFTIEINVKIRAEDEETAERAVYTEVCKQLGFEINESEDAEEEREEDQEPKKKREPKEELIESIPKGYISLDQVGDLTKLDILEINKLIYAGKFPKATKGWGKKKLWLQSDIQGHIDRIVNNESPSDKPVQVKVITELSKKSNVVIDAFKEIEDEEEEEQFVTKDRVRIITGLDDEIIDMFVGNGKLPYPNDEGQFPLNGVYAFVEKRNEKLSKHKL